MSHKATYWLASLAPASITAGAFRVLFHLCDHHNDERDPEAACYPSQETLMAKTGMSNGGLNKVLGQIEEAGLIRRKRSTVPGSSARRTYYILGCDMDQYTSQTPQSGGSSNSTAVETASNANSTPVEAVRGANSTFGGSKLHPSGEEPVRNLGYGGGDAREPDFREPVSQTVAAVAEVLNPVTDRERILEACGVDPVSGLTGRGGQRIGTQADMHHVKRWGEDLGLTTDEQVAVISEVMSRKTDGPPGSLKYFNEPMQRFAGARNATPLAPINPTQSNVTSFKGSRHDRVEQRHREDIALDEYIRRVGEGTLNRGADPSDPFSGR